MSDINYKMKYQALKSKFMSSVDMAFRLGYEQGAKDMEVQAAAEAQQAQAEADMATEQGGMPGEEGQAPGQEPDGQAAPGEQVPAEGETAVAPMAESEHPGGSELDQHISELEGLLSKGEMTGEDMKKALHTIKSYRQTKAIRANDAAVKRIAKAVKVKKPFIMSKGATQNLSSAAKGAVNMQEKLVNDIMKSWQEEEAKGAKSIAETLNIEGLTKKE